MIGVRRGRNFAEAILAAMRHLFRARAVIRCAVWRPWPDAMQGRSAPLQGRTVTRAGDMSPYAGRPEFPAPPCDVPQCWHCKQRTTLQRAEVRPKEVPLGAASKIVQLIAVRALRYAAHQGPFFSDLTSIFNSLLTALPSISPGSNFIFWKALTTMR